MEQPAQIVKSVRSVGSVEARNSFFISVLVFGYLVIWLFGYLVLERSLSRSADFSRIIAVEKITEWGCAVLL
jgi:hypothetical protein